MARWCAWTGSVPRYGMGMVWVPYGYWRVLKGIMMGIDGDFDWYGLVMDGYRWLLMGNEGSVWKIFLRKVLFFLNKFSINLLLFVWKFLFFFAKFCESVQACAGAWASVCLQRTRSWSSRTFNVGWRRRWRRMRVGWRDVRGWGVGALGLRWSGMSRKKRLRIRNLKKTQEDQEILWHVGASWSATMKINGRELTWVNSK